MNLLFQPYIPADVVVAVDSENMGVVVTGVAPMFNPPALDAVVLDAGAIENPLKRFCVAGSVPAVVVVEPNENPAVAGCGVANDKVGVAAPVVLVPKVNAVLGEGTAAVPNDKLNDCCGTKNRTLI